jgi:hypothetical protein
VLIFLMIFWLADGVLLMFCLRSLVMLPNGSDGRGPWRMLGMSGVLAAMIISSMVLAIQVGTRWARWVALGLVAWPALAIAAILLYLVGVGLFVKDWK